ncbi:MAG: metallophosphoesterase [Verrucomicrobia bacterium]|nr:metallophosphoesterase [Verrucomicrobiota bacterium]
MSSAPTSLSRRQFLRSAGGITFLALLPVGRGLFGAPWIKPLTIPVFTALPYIQSGPEGKLIPGGEIARLAWQTEQREAQFEVEFGRDEHYGKTATVARSARDYRGKGDKDSVFNYVCSFTGLVLGVEYRYRVRCNGETIAEGYFTTRQPRGRRIRFVAFGDNSFGDPSDRAIAYQAYRNHPDFIMNTGDNVYDAGLDTEYSRFFFPVYNADIAGPRIGAPLLRSVPFYSVLANHDVAGMNAEKTLYFADFKTGADSLAYFTNFHFPLNGPDATAYPPVMRGPDERIADFKACAAGRFPRMANYSYDVGDAHFLCLDSNTYTDPTDAGLQAWIEADLAATDARWKFVAMHHPPFNIGAHHGHEQHMRVLAPTFEKHGVNFVLSGHEHNYQRTRPIRFTPRDVANAHNLHSKERVVPGEIKLDLAFDGEKQTKADGIIYITTGAGGKYLYDPEYNNNPEMWVMPGDGNLSYTVTMVSDRHSITVFDVERDEVLMRQVDQHGNELDRIRVT